MARTFHVGFWQLNIVSEVIQLVFIEGESHTRLYFSCAKNVPFYIINYQALDMTRSERKLEKNVLSSDRKRSPTRSIRLRAKRFLASDHMNTVRCCLFFPTHPRSCAPTQKYLHFTTRASLRLERRFGYCFSVCELITTKEPRVTVQPITIAAQH